MKNNYLSFLILVILIFFGIAGCSPVGLEGEDPKDEAEVPAGFQVVDPDQMQTGEYVIKRLEYRELPYTDDMPEAFTLPFLTDEDGVFIWKQGSTNTFHYHPVAIAQRVLAWAHEYRLSGEENYLRLAKLHINKLVELAQEENDALYFPYTFAFPLHDIEADTMQAPWYSGMAQGQILSALVRMYEITGNEEYLAASKKVVRSFSLLPPAEIWTVYLDEEGYYWISEYPLEGEPTAALNGFIYGLYGLYDYYRMDEDPEVGKLIRAALATIRQYIGAYRNEGDISYYCLKHHVKSAKYHDIHIRQLETLYKITGDAFFKEMAANFHSDHP